MDGGKGLHISYLPSLWRELIIMNENGILQNNGGQGTPLHWDFCSRDQIASLARHDAVVIIPTRSTEQHGPHLPVRTDAIIASEIATRTVKRESKSVAVLLLPALTYGSSQHHMMYSGTVSLHDDLFTSQLVDIGNSIVNHGFRRLLFVNGRGGNTGPSRLAIDRTRQGAECEVYIVASTYWQLITDTIRESRQSHSGGIGHAGEIETSLMLALYPQLVHPPLPSGCFSQSPQGWWCSEDWFGASKVQLGFSLTDHSASGVLGDPSMATAAFGHRILAAAVEQTSELIVSMASWRYAEFQMVMPELNQT